MLVNSVYAIISRLDPALTTLAHDGPARFRDQFELVYRHRATLCIETGSHARTVTTNRLTKKLERSSSMGDFCLMKVLRMLAKRSRAHYNTLDRTPR